MLFNTPSYPASSLHFKYVCLFFSSEWKLLRGRDVSCALLVFVPSTTYAMQMLAQELHHYVRQLKPNSSLWKTVGIDTSSGVSSFICSLTQNQSAHYEPNTELVSSYPLELML